MYEMCVGPEKAGGALVWHVMAKQAAATLCGEKLRERIEASDGERARHCPDCMASFEKPRAPPPCCGPAREMPAPPPPAGGRTSYGGPPCSWRAACVIVGWVHGHGAGLHR
ncbi:hypothetical protein GCM10010385_19790 [Streptomyces geysiriensis]|nr:hypothetical protein GCM10010385_19790 [Streptomyces geysiriensis]